MASVIFYLDTRNTRIDGTHRLKLKINIDSKRSTLINTMACLSANQWEDNKVVNHEDKRKLNIQLGKMYAEVSGLLYDLSVSGDINRMTTAEIKAHIESVLGRDTRSAYSFIDHFRVFGGSRTKQSSCETYDQTLIRIGKFDKRNLLFTDITVQWLNDFEAHMKKDNLKVNTIHLHFRNIRAVLNDAINRDKAPMSCYPFRKFKLKKETTRKRSLTVEQLKQFRDHDCESHETQYIDIFMLIFYLGGINIIDLVNLKAINNGYIEYRRAKTGRLYKIPVVPQALEIINKYKGDNYLLNILDRYVDYRNYRHRINNNLSSIGSVEIVKAEPKSGDKQKSGPGKKVKTGLFPDLSTYWARHTWATIAASIDIPKETIAATLGHGGNDVTDIYIDFDQKKIDEAIQRVANYVTPLSNDQAAAQQQD